PLGAALDAGKDWDGPEGNGVRVPRTRYFPIPWARPYPINPPQPGHVAVLSLAPPPAHSPRHTQSAFVPARKLTRRRHRLRGSVPAGTAGRPGSGRSVETDLRPEPAG